MKKTLARFIIATLLLVTVGLAITRPPQIFYPAVTIEAIAPNETITLRFLLEGRPNITECETITANIAR
jgi:hypothetical protein